MIWVGWYLVVGSILGFVCKEIHDRKCTCEGRHPPGIVFLVFMVLWPLVAVMAVMAVFYRRQQ